NNEQIGYDFRGKDLAGKTFVVKGNSFSIKLSGSSSNCYGFSLSDITVNPTFTENDYNLLYLPDDNYNSDNYTIKLNYWNVYGKWQTIPMKKSAYLINGKPAYCATVTEDFDLANTIQFQVYEGDLWKDQTELQNVKYSDYDGCIVFSDDREKAAPVDVNYNGLTGYAIGDEVTITGYNGDATELVIPEKIEGKTVTGIVEGALENNDKLEKITVPATVTYIGEDAFPDVEIHGLKRAYIYTYCKEMDYEFVDDTIAATAVALNGDYGDTITLEMGDTMDLDFAITPANSTDLLTVTSNNDCVSIDGNKLKANWNGTATVTAEATSGVQCTFTVNVIYVNEFTVSKLPDKLVYTKGEELDTTGLNATVSFSNWTSKETTDFTVSGYDKTKTGMQTVTLTYTAKNDQEYSDSYLVEVKEAKGRPIGIEIKKYPETLQYKKSSTTSLDTDLELELVYDSGEKEAVENYTVDDSAFDIESVGTYGITVTAEGFSTSYNVKVYRRNPDDEDPAQPESPFKTFYYIDSNGNNCKNIIVALSSGDGTVNQYMEKTSDKYQGSNIYKLTYDAEKFTTVKLFNYSSSYDKTAIYDGYGYGHIKEFGNDVQNGKYYLPDKDIWINSINGTATVYLVNTSGWSSPQAYVWRDPSLALKQWPGEEMTPTNYYYDNHRVYSYTFDTAIYNKIIFNGRNADGGSEQTENLDVQPGKYFFNNENLWEDNRPALSVDTDNEMTKELTPDADDENIEKFGFKSDITYSGAELLGVQKKKNAERSMRFVSAVSSDILNASNVENYGYVLTKISLPSSEVKSQMNKLTVNNGRVFNCKDSGNTISGKYGTDEAATRYKYITMAVNNVPEGNGIAARFFIKTTDGEYHYAKYTDKNGNQFDGCVAHISDLTD
ncbi:MAG: starch-binding protein, partial [Ruminococcus sp.]|nr:starch-binding protein [Ruminococcus sp.]